MKRLLRSATAPLRSFFNAHFEAVKEDGRAQAHHDRTVADRNRQEIVAAIDRLEEAVGLLGLQLSSLRSDLDELRSGGDGRSSDGGAPRA